MQRAVELRQVSFSIAVSWHPQRRGRWLQEVVVLVVYRSRRWIVSPGIAGLMLPT